MTKTKTLTATKILIKYGYLSDTLVCLKTRCPLCDVDFAANPVEHFVTHSQEDRYASDLFLFRRAKKVVPILTDENINAPIL
jgi:hypothetical protein